MQTSKPISAILTGPSYRAHLVPVALKRLGRRPYPAALCGTTPAKDSEGWKRCPDKRATCPRCLVTGPHPPKPKPKAATTSPPAAAPAAAAPRRGPRVTSAPPRRDQSADAYESRVLHAMERSIRKGDALRCSQQVGRDMGGGWIILGTDGVRALCRKAAEGAPAAEAPMVTAKPITSAGSPVHGFALTPEVESAMRTVWKTMDRKRPIVWLRIEAAKRRLSIEPVLGTGLTVPLVPAAGGPCKLVTQGLGVNLRFLLDACGRGGRVGYEKGVHGEHKVVTIDTEDGLRYVVMPCAMGAPPKPNGAAK